LIILLFDDIIKIYLFFGAFIYLNFFKGGVYMSKFRKSKSKLAVALLGTLFCNVNGASAMNSRVNINKTGVKSSQTLGAVGGGDFW